MHRLEYPILGQHHIGPRVSLEYPNTRQDSVPEDLELVLRVPLLSHLGPCANPLEPLGICLEPRLRHKSLEPAREVLRVILLSTRASERY